jgi:hypothetical protein
MSAAGASEPDLLTRTLGEELRKPVAAEARAVVDLVLRRHGPAVRAVLFYGAGFREGGDPDAVLDLCVLVGRYRDVAANALLAAANRILPPNVFYVEVPFGERTVRAKYAVVTMEDFARRTGPAGFDAYFWARFAQPVALVQARSAKDETAVVAAIRGAVLRFLHAALPLAPAEASVAELWIGVFRQTYRGELRPERDDRPRTLYESSAARYELVTRAALAELPEVAAVETPAGELRLRTAIPEAERRRARLVWAVRRRYGKLLAILRLLKALVTFDGGIDYAFWKIARHTGTPVVPGSRVGVFRLLRLWAAYLRSGGAAQSPASAEERRRKSVSSKPPASYA